MNPDNLHDDPVLAAFEARSRALLRERAAAPLPGHLQSRLSTARAAALAEFRERAGTPRFRIPGIWLPLGSVAAAGVLGIAVWLVQPHATAPAVAIEASPVEDAEMLASKDGPELVAEDADFYEWAGSEQDAGAG
jgi:hypothetical protein